MGDKNSVVLDRFKALVDNSGKTRQEIAQDIGCDTSTVTKQYNGDMKISVDYLVKYSKYFDVSADYLLGLAKTPAFDKDINYFSEYTGLSLMAIENLHECVTKLEITQEDFNKVIEAATDEQKEILGIGNEFLKEFISVNNTDNKDFIFLINELLELPNAEFRNAILVIAQYIKAVNAPEDIRKYEKDFAEFSVYKLTKKIIGFADSIKDDYLKYRGKNNGDS